MTTALTRASAIRRLRLTITLLEDAHLGSGVSGPGINALVARDREGLPVIWASHLEGLLREQAMLQDPSGGKAKLFGEAGRRRQVVTFTSLHCERSPEQLRVWRATARRAFDNRAPADDTLRATQMVPKGTVFSGALEVPAEHEEPLRALLRQVRSIGQGRASGVGAARLELSDEAPTPRGFQLEEGATRLRLLLCALEPVCVAATAIPGNLIPTASFLPGRTVLGALASWLEERGQREAATLLVSGEISVSDALPLPEEPRPEELTELEVLPAPLALKVEKPGRSDRLEPWWAWKEAEAARYYAPDHKEPGDNDARLGDDVKLKRPPDDLYLVRRGGAEWRTYRPTIRARLRSGRPRPGQPHPSLFAIEQLAEQTRFLLELQGSSATLAALCEALRPVLERTAWLRVGRAGAAVEMERAVARRAEPAATPAGESLLTLTSDLLARDPQLRWFTALTPEDFLHVAGWPREPINVRSASQDGTVIRGFNGTARLWRLPIGAVRRGSVFRVSGPGVETLVRAAAEGRWLGERCHEGFGRFRIDAKAELPGLRSKVATSEARLEPGTPDAPEEARCAAMKQLVSAHPALAAPRDAKDPTPSLSQWMDLASELEAGDKSAIPRRRAPETAGGRGWRHEAACAVLAELSRGEGLEEQAARARLFVRWLRLELRATAEKEPV